MQAEADVSPFDATVAHVKKRLAKLNSDGSFNGVVARFDRLLHELPSDFFICEPVTAVVTTGVDPLPAVIVHPGPRLHAIALALWAFDLDMGKHTG